MAFSLILAHEALPQRDPIIVLYGETGSGKTTLAFTADNPVLLDFDQGVQRSVNRKTSVQFETYDDVIAFTAPGGPLDQLRPGVLICDTGGALLDDLMTPYAITQSRHNVKGGGVLSQQGFGAVKELFATFLRRCKALNVLPVFICHVAEKGDADERRLRPKLTGGSYDILMAKADLVGYLEMRGNQRTLSFSPTARCVGKNCVEFEPMAIPHYEAPEFAGFFQRVIDKTIARMAAMTSAQLKALEEVKQIQESILDCADLLALELVCQQIEQLSPMYQAQVRPVYIDRFARIWKAEHLAPAQTLEDFNTLVQLANALDKPLQVVKKDVAAAAGELGFLFDKPSNCFVAAPEPKSQPTTAASTGQAVEEETAGGVGLEDFLAQQQSAGAAPAARRTVPPATEPRHPASRKAA